MAPDRKRRRLSGNGDFTANLAPPDGGPAPHGQRGGDEELSSAQPTASLFVRSLPLTATTQSLTDFFSQSYPLKHAVVILDRDSGKSRGFGFVTFADVEDAKQAKDGLHDTLFEGRKLRIDFAKPRHRASRDGREDGPASNSQDAPSTKTLAPAPAQGRQTEEICRLIVRNLPWSVKEPRQLARLFMSYGKIKDTTLPKCKPGLSPGFGFVALRGKQNAERAIAGVNGKLVDSRAIAVDWAVDKDTWQQLQAGKVSPPPEPTETLEADSSSPSDSQQRHEEGSSSLSGTETYSPPDNSNPEGPDSASEYSEESTGLARSKGIRGAQNNVASTLFVRNLPYSATDEDLLELFKSFGPVRYARVVIDPETNRARGTGFVCFYDQKDVRQCLSQAPHTHASGQNAAGKKDARYSSLVTSLLHDPSSDPFGRFTMNDRVVQVSQAVGKDEAHRLMAQRKASSATKDNDRRHLYLLTEGTVTKDSPLHASLSPSELRVREQNLLQRERMVKDNPALFLSLTRISVRNLPRHVKAKDLKALAREAVVGFAKGVKAGQRQPLTKEEQRRDREQMKIAESTRRSKGVGIVKQAKIIYESQDGAKTTASGDATRSRGYGFIEYTSHRWALMGLRWLNGHQVPQTLAESGSDPVANKRLKRLVAEFAIENAHVLAQRNDKANGAHGPPAFYQHGVKGQAAQSRDRPGLERKKSTAWQAGDGTRDQASESGLSAAQAGSTNDSYRKSSQGVQHLIGRKRASRKAVRNRSR